MHDANAAETRILNLTRHFSHPPEDVFRALSEAEEWVKWMGPAGFTVNECVMGRRIGDAWSATMRSPEGTLHTVKGVRREYVPPRRLAFTWQWQGRDGAPDGVETLVAIDLMPEGNGTRMNFLHTGFESETARDSHAKGWNGSFDKLESWRPA
ncbi:MAG: SRPBCC family protein [Alphaproteobacteria bacterium]